MIANMSAYLIARHYRPQAIYEALLAQDGIHLEDRAVLDTLEELKLERMIRPRGDSFVSFEPASPASLLLRETSEHGRQIAFPVLDANGKLVGLIYAEDLAVLKSSPELELVVNAADLMRPPTSVRADEDLRTAFELMRDEGLRELPVLDAERRVVGFIDEASIVDAFLRASLPKRGAKSIPSTDADSPSPPKVSGFH
jgi:CIC family chloride channel protein